MSAFRVSRTGLPLSHDSATAMDSRFSSMRSAILLRTLARSAGDVLPQADAAAWAASSAFSMSASSERGISQNDWPLTGLTFSKYRRAAGATHSPPMKLRYRGEKDISEPSAPGRAYTVMAFLLPSRRKCVGHH